jgi:predicted DNA-binding transcriptional regulator AlpA
MVLLALFDINQQAPPMLTDADLATAERLLASITQIVRPAQPEALVTLEQLLAGINAIVQSPEPEFVRAGELPKILNCSRTQAWILTKSGDFPAAIELGPRLKLWPRRGVIDWMQSRRAPGKQDAQPLVGPGVDVSLSSERRGKRRTHTDTINDMRAKSPAQAAAPARADAPAGHPPAVDLRPTALLGGGVSPAAEQLGRINPPRPARTLQSQAHWQHRSPR